MGLDRHRPLARGGGGGHGPGPPWRPCRRQFHHLEPQLSGRTRALGMALNPQRAESPGSAGPVGRHGAGAGRLLGDLPRRSGQRRTGPQLRAAVVAEAGSMPAAAPRRTGRRRPAHGPRHHDAGRFSAVSRAQPQRRGGRRVDRPGWPHAAATGLAARDRRRLVGLRRPQRPRGDHGAAGYRGTGLVLQRPHGRAGMVARHDGPPRVHARRSRSAQHADHRGRPRLRPGRRWKPAMPGRGHGPTHSGKRPAGRVRHVAGRGYLGGGLGPGGLAAGAGLARDRAGRRQAGRSARFAGRLRHPRRPSPLERRPEPDRLRFAHDRHVGRPQADSHRQRGYSQRPRPGYRCGPLGTPLGRP